MVKNWNKIKERQEAFWNKSYLDRCMLSLKISPQRDWLVNPDSPYTAEEQYTCPEIAFENVMEDISQTQYFGDAFPAYCPNFGTAGHVQFLGAKPLYQYDTIWFSPILTEPDASQLIFQSDSPCVEKQLEFVRKLAALSQGKFFTGMPDNCGIIDALAELRGTQNLLIDMVENPEFVEEACHKIFDVWKETAPKFFDIIYENNDRGSIHSWMQTYTPGRHAQIQCDFSVMISKQYFDKFVLPELFSTSQFLDHTTYHLDGQEQLRHLDSILSVDRIDNIQWTSVAGQPRVSEFIPSLRKIQNSGKGLILFPKFDEAEVLMKELSHNGLLLIINDLQSEEEAQYLIHKAEALAHK